jgi:plastocyanin
MRALAVVLAALGVAATASAATPRLSAYVDDNFKIGVTRAGKTVNSLKAGTYLFVVDDSTSSHNFHLSGPGVNKATSVDGKGTFRWKVTLRKGTYSYVCDPHASFMHGSFTVG